MISDPATFLDSMLACAVCIGGDDATTTAANLAIGFLGVIILSVLGGILKFMHYLSRQQKLAEATPDALADLSAGH